MQVRIMFATEPLLEAEVRRRIDRAGCESTAPASTGATANRQLLGLLQVSTWGGRTRLTRGFTPSACSTGEGHAGQIRAGTARSIAL